MQDTLRHSRRCCEHKCSFGPHDECPVYVGHVEALESCKCAGTVGQKIFNKPSPERSLVMEKRLQQLVRDKAEFAGMMSKPKTNRTFKACGFNGCRNECTTGRHRCAEHYGKQRRHENG